jgi:hypothetical protein
MMTVEAKYRQDLDIRKGWIAAFLQDIVLTILGKKGKHRFIITNIWSDENFKTASHPSILRSFPKL